MYESDDLQDCDKKYVSNLVSGLSGKKSTTKPHLASFIRTKERPGLTVLIK